MATRTYCDHCGNKITTKNVLSYGPMLPDQEFVTAKMDAQRAALSARMANMHSTPTQPLVQIQQPKKPAILEMCKITHVDLCNTCVPIWMERVRKLTSQTDDD